METKVKKTGLTAAAKAKKTITKKETFAEIAKKARELGGKLFKEGKIKPL